MTSRIAACSMIAFLVPAAAVGAVRLGVGRRSPVAPGCRLDRHREQPAAPVRTPAGRQGGSRPGGRPHPPAAGLRNGGDRVAAPDAGRVFVPDGGLRRFPRDRSDSGHRHQHQRAAAADDVPVLAGVAATHATVSHRSRHPQCGRLTRHRTGARPGTAALRHQQREAALLHHPANPERDRGQRPVDRPLPRARSHPAGPGGAEGGAPIRCARRGVPPGPGRAVADHGAERAGVAEGAAESAARTRCAHRLRRGGREPHCPDGNRSGRGSCPRRREPS